MRILTRQPEGYVAFLDWAWWICLLGALVAWMSSPRADDMGSWGLPGLALFLTFGSVLYRWVDWRDS